MGPAIVTVLVAIIVVVLVQHFRYLRIRRAYAEDRQRLLHPSGAFHVITFFRVRNGDKVVDAARRYRDRVMSAGRPRIVYAGQAGFSVGSEQLGERPWHGVLLFEYGSREDYEGQSADCHRQAAREEFADSYLHGMRRNRAASLAIPQFFLRLRLRDLLTGRWRTEPLEPLPEVKTSPALEIWRRRVSRLRALHEINRRALVVYNLTKQGSPEQQAADEEYGRKMFARMAALSHGPLHLGRSVALEGSARFDRVVVVHYPSAAYFAELISSSFFHQFVGQKQLADSIAVATVPITGRL